MNLLKEVEFNRHYTLLFTSQPGPCAAQEKFDELISPIWTFYITQSFLSRDPFGFLSLGYPGVQGSSWQGHACVKKLPWVGGEVCAKFGGDWSGSLGMKRGHIYCLVFVHFISMVFQILFLHITDNVYFFLPPLHLWSWWPS